ncbi:hypothetical protein SK128_012938 [Halocaridina rubra]|uniref:Uncharacterized protein n=1 Tax=Halocaridina rubra TaxID=373956 RepID=A0AAN8ZTT8_HALRR
MEQLKQQIRCKPDTASKFVNYRSELNSGLDVHKIYKKSVYIPDYLRVSFTRLKLMSHTLKIETGRWSRLPREQRSPSLYLSALCLLVPRPDEDKCPRYPSCHNH